MPSPLATRRNGHQPSRTPKEIVDLVTPIENATQARRARMDGDRKLLRLEPYDVNTDSEGKAAGSDYRSFTANEPLAFLKKVMAVLSDAKLLVQVPYGMAQEQERYRYDLAERWHYGNLASANERLRRQVLLEVQDQLAGIVPVRGWGIVFALLRNRDDGTSYADLQVWDPRNCTWQVGDDGLEWICYKSTRTAREVRAEYPGVRLEGKRDDEVLEVYNFTDKTRNTVCTADEALKASTEHGWNRVPASVAPVGPMPRIWDENDIQGEDTDTETDYGESIFAPNRRLYQSLNELLSILLELASKQLNQTYVHNTDDEGNELEESPNVSNAVIAIPKEDKLAPLMQVESTRDLLVLVETVMGMIQRGALPHVSYGQLAINISGFAVTQLNKQHITVIGPVAKCIQSLILDALSMLQDQFVTGRFNPITLRGMGNNRDYMQVTFHPEMLMNLPPPTVQLVAELPEDDVSRMSMAQQAKQGAILPDRYIWEKVLKLQDTAQIQRMMDEQMARTGSPLAGAYSMAKSAFQDGNQALGQIYAEDMKIQQMMRAMQMLQLQMQLMMGGGGGMGGMTPLNPGAGAEGGGQQAPAPTGMEPEVMPFIMQNGSPAPSPRQGAPNQPPGAPRPGARTNPMSSAAPVVQAWGR
jgi:hypothetical protein